MTKIYYDADDHTQGYCAVHQERSELVGMTPAYLQTKMVQFDNRKGATWHCIVGRNFGSFVTHGSSDSWITRVEPS